MHLLYKIGDKTGLVKYEDAWVFIARDVFIPETRDYLITACGMKWNSNNAKIRIKVNDEIVAQQNCELVSYAGSLKTGDKISLEAINLFNTLLMLYKIKERCTACEKEKLL